MIYSRLTVKCPKLAQHKSNVSLDKAEIMSKFHDQAMELKGIVISKLNDSDMTACWCNDGHVVISCSNTLLDVEKFIEDEGLEIQIDKTDFKHRLKEVSKGIFEEDIDEIFEPKTTGEKKLLKSKTVINQYKLKRGI